MVLISSLCLQLNLFDLRHFGGDVGKNAGDALLPELLCALYVIDGEHQAWYALFTQLSQQVKINVSVVEMPGERNDLLEFDCALQRHTVSNGRQWPGASQLS